MLENRSVESHHRFADFSSDFGEILAVPSFFLERLSYNSFGSIFLFGPPSPGKCPNHDSCASIFLESQDENQLFQWFSLTRGLISTQMMFGDENSRVCIQIPVGKRSEMQNACETHNPYAWWIGRTPLKGFCQYQNKSGIFRPECQKSGAALSPSSVGLGLFSHRSFAWNILLQKHFFWFRPQMRFSIDLRPVLSPEFQEKRKSGAALAQS